MKHECSAQHTTANAPTMYKLKVTKTKLKALVTDYTKELDWVPELPSTRSSALEFKHIQNSFWLEWWQNPGIEYKFYLTSVCGKCILLIELYDFNKIWKHASFCIPLDELNRRGMLTAI